ncbi:MAG: T9SS type A sorting domain-containing protein [Lewinellaceae bacterium]|nr:T9SS type A sorting domain-containing protein [Lewinellaceae bacterium]
MKNLITFLLYCLSVTALIAQAKSESRLQVLDAGLTRTTLRLDLDGFDKTLVNTPNGPAIIPGFQHGTPMLQKGDPDLPKFSTALMIPNKGKMAVELLDADYEDIPNVEIAPSKGNLLRTVNPDEIPFEYGETYVKDHFFPGTLATLQAPFVLRETRGQGLWIFPLQYNPVKKVLRVYHSVTLRVFHTSEPGENERVGGPVFSQSRAFDQLYQALYVNNPVHAADRGSTREPEKMLVIADDNLLDELQPLITWKRQMGIHTTVVPVSEIGSSEADDVYNFVKQYYAEHGISYLLLVGDENAIKPQMRSNGASYACDPCFGYMSGDDHLPEILVGRLHASTPEQMRIMVNRNLEYEINPLVDTAQNWIGTGLAAASNEGAGIGDDNQADWEHGNEWKAAHLADGFEQYWEFYDGSHSADSPTPGDSTADKNGNPANVDILNVLNNRGVSLYNYTGHGWEQGLVSGNFNNDAVGNMRNTGRYPILIAVACCAGNFTNGECLGEAWQRAGNTATGEPWGGVAGFFSSDYQSWSPPMEGQDGMNQYLVDADGISLAPTLGGMLTYGNARMIAAYGLGGEVMADFWNPFADPTTVPRTALPKVLTALHTDSIAFETTSLLVSCPVEGALVSLFWENQTWAVATVENGMAALEFAPLHNTGQLTVTVSQFNYAPYQGTIAVKPAVKPFVVNQETLLDDGLGNNNQKADFGETVVLRVMLKNIGLGLAEVVHAEISTANPYVSILSNQAQPGDLASGNAAQATFVFQVNEAIPNGTIVDFLFNIDYSDSLHYSATIPVKLFAPKLEIGAWTIDDTAQGNGNGRLESGESAVITILTKNTGGSDLPSALGTLSALSPYLTVNTAPTDLGLLSATGGEQSAQFQLKVAPNAPVSVMASLHYAVEGANGNYTAEKNLGPIMLNAIVETFESGNFNGFSWEMSGDKPWMITTSNPYAGQYCSRSGVITHNQRSTFQITLLVQEDGLVSFARAVSSEADFDFLRFFIDNKETGAWSGNLPWAEVQFPVTAGQHTLRWSYEKDDFVSEGADRAWVDEIILPPHQIVVGTHSAMPGSLQLQALPNPTDGLFQIQINTPKEQVLSVRVFDASGRLMQTLPMPERSPAGLSFKTVDLHDAEPGIYLVQVLGENGGQTIKVVVY